MKQSLLVFLLFLSAGLIWNCGNSGPSQTESSSADSDQEVWIDLLDKEHISQWKGYNGETLPPGWSVNNDSMWYSTGELLLEQDYKGGKDIIYGGQEFKYFELSVDWKIPEGGNSGIFYHVKEGYKSPSSISPEYQLIDDENYAAIHDLVGYNSQFGAEHPELLQDWQMTGADYAMHVVETENKILHPTGKWNNTRIVVQPGLTEHWLNGVKLLSFEPWSDDWYKKKEAGKWESAPDYGKFEEGYIGFQDHGSPLWFKNIKIRVIN